MAWFRRRQRQPDSRTAPPRPQTGASWSEAEDPSWSHPERWRLRDWKQPDLSYADALMLERYEDWDLYVPSLQLVQCGDKVKPALFFKIGSGDFDDWASAVDPVSIGWNWYRTKSENPYVIIEFWVMFRSSNRAPLGMGGAGTITVTTEADHQFSHQLRSRALLDPGDAATRAAIEAWVAAPAPTMFFFVEERFRATSYVSMGLEPETKRDLLRVLSEATAELRTDGIVHGGFKEACALLKPSLPGVSWWRE
jgi:hypothetical protein